MYRVLIVEDEDLIRKGIIFMMNWEKVGCTVVGEAADGEEGLEKIRLLSPDIVICDIRMPVMDGLEMLQLSLKEQEYAVIVLSGYGEFEYAQKAISLGVRDYLLKPVNFDQLTASVQKITQQLTQKRQLDNAIQGMDRENLLQGDWLLPGASKNKVVAAALDYIKAHYCEKVSLGEVAEYLSISGSYLNTKFKSVTGYTFNDFLNRYRIAQAVDLMQKPGSNLRLYEVAEAVGFSDYRYFNKVFKKYVGYSPNRFVLGEKER